MTLNISNNNYSTTRNARTNKKTNNNINFGGLSESAKAITKEFSPINKALANLISFKENKGGMSHLRFIQDTTTNWLPKVTFSRSLADFTEFSFLEFLESGLFYYAPNLVGENILKKHVVPKFLQKKELEHFSDPLINLIRDPNKKCDKESLQKIAPVKAATVLACTCIPCAEYALSFAKNLFTLKVFKKADFNNITNLEKGKKEDPKQQERVETSSKKHIKSASVTALVGLGGALALASVGHRSKALQKLSEGILHPGAKLYSALEKKGVKSGKLQIFLETYLNLDFDKTNDCKLCLSNGQLAVSVLSGVTGYFAAAKDRGQLDFLEVATRVPLVAAYTIFGTSLIEPSIKNNLFKKGKYSELLYKDPNDNSLKIKTLEELPEIAKKAAVKSGKTESEEIKRLFRDKAKLNLTPFGFSLLVMGFTLAGISRFWTQYRFNKGIGRTPENDPLHLDSKYINLFSGKNTVKSNEFKNFEINKQLTEKY